MLLLLLLEAYADLEVATTAIRLNRLLTLPNSTPGRRLRCQGGPPLTGAARDAREQERTVKQDAVDGGLRAMQLAMKHVTDQAGGMDVEPTSPPPGWRGMPKASGPFRFIPSQQPKRHPGGVDSRERDDSRTGVKTPKTN